MNLKQIVDGDVHDRIHFYCIVLLVATLPLPYFALNNFFIILLILNWLVKIIRLRRYSLRHNSLLYGPVALFAMYVVAVFYSSDISAALSSLEKKCILLLFPLVVGLSVFGLDRRHLRYIMISFLISCIAVSIICIIHVFYTNARQGIDFSMAHHWYYSEENLARYFGHHVYLSMYLCFCLVIIADLLASGQKKPVRLTLYALIPYILFMIIALASRMAFIAILVLSCFFIFTYLKKHLLQKITAVALFLSALSIVAYQLPFTRDKFIGLFNINNSNTHTYKYNASVRGNIWKGCYNIIKENPLMGVGTGDLQRCLIEEYKKTNYEEGLYYGYNTHNQFLDVWATCGILALLFLLFTLAMPAYIGLKQNNPLLFCFIVICVLFFFSETLFARHKGIVFFSLFYSLLVGTYIPNGPFFTGKESDTSKTS